MKNEPRQVDEVSLVRQLIGAGSYEQALALLRTTLSPAQDFTVQAKAARLVSKIPTAARTMEEFIFNDIVEVARALGCSVVVGRFRPTAKNKLVAGLYERLGLAKVSESAEETVWRLALDADLAARKTYVSVKKAELADA